MKYRIGICDDERIYLEQIKDIIKNFSERNAFSVDIFEFESGKQFIENGLHLNLLFLDIEMEEQSGIEIKNKLSMLPNSCKIIFVTNYEDRMQEAFGKNVIAFINKKNLIDIHRYLKRVMNEYHAHRVFSIGDSQIDLFDIIYIKADGSYSRIITKNKSYVYCVYLVDIARRIDIEAFVRCHRSYIVNLRYIKDVTKNQIELFNGERVPVSKKYRDSLLNQYFTFLREV